MRLLLQLFFIFLLCLLGQGISMILPFAFPSSIISLILLLVLLILKWVKLEQIKEFSEYLLGNMAFFFIPAGVYIIERYDLIRGKVMLLLLICIITTVLTFLSTYYTVKLAMRFQKKGDHHGDHTI